jgi:hypothetical protein
MESLRSPRLHWRLLRRVGILVPLYLLLSVVGCSERLLGQGAPQPSLEITVVQVDPSAPAADTLCRLTVAITNRGTLPAYALGFEVAIEGRSLPVYTNQLLMEVLPPGKVTEVRLFNFWTTETDRPRPADGKLDLAVTLREAQWLEVTFEQAPDGERSEIWTPKGAVPGLPVSATKTLSLR